MHPALYPFSSVSSKVESKDEVQVTADNEEEDEEGDVTLASNLPNELPKLQFKNWDLAYLKTMEMKGELDLQPHIQRDYEWKENQASLYIESIIRGYPCLPEVTLLEVEDENGKRKFAVFDGQQRLTSIFLYMDDKRGKDWLSRKNCDGSFRLTRLAMLKHLEGKTYKELSQGEQNRIDGYDVRCAVIPKSWSVDDVTDFFTRIQGGGTPMNANALHRVLTQGPFSRLLDDLIKKEDFLRVFKGSDKSKPDDIQQLLVRYYSLRNGHSNFCKPTVARNSVHTRKHYNTEMKMKSWDISMSQSELIDPLKKSLKLIEFVFHENEPFRRPVALVKKGVVVDNSELNKVWRNSKIISRQIFDCTVSTFANHEIQKEEAAIQDNAPAIRIALIELMQTDPSFTDTLTNNDTSTRVRLFESTVLQIIKDAIPQNGRKNIDPQTRRDLIEEKLKSGSTCRLCSQPLGPYADHLHIDHINPVSNGGTNEKHNLQVVHKICNLRKSNKVLKKKRSSVKPAATVWVNI